MVAAVGPILAFVHAFTTPTLDTRAAPPVVARSAPVVRRRTICDAAPASSLAFVSRRAAVLGTVFGGYPLATAWAADDIGKARAQITSSEAALDDLMSNFDAIVAADGGNGVRRVLGKLGPTSPLYRVDKPLNLVARELDDDSSFALVDEFLGQLDAADGDAYSSIFVPTGGGTTPEYWLERSKKEIAKARGTLDQILKLQ